MKERVLLTGASGHIGRYLLAAQPDDYEVVSLACSGRLPGGTSVPGTKGSVAGALVEMGNAGAKAVYAKNALEDFVR